METGWQLGACGNTSNSVPDVLRPLTEAELEQNARYVAVIKRIENRLMLFRVLTLNYEDWVKSLKRLVFPGPQPDDAKLVVQQRMMNFLSSAFAVTEHFKTEWNSTYEKKHPKRADLSSFEGRWNDVSFHSAFLRDYRHFVQHYAAPIGGFTRKASKHSVTLEVYENTDQLLAKKGFEWVNSNLDATRTRIDLIKAVDDYYYYLLHDYARYVVKFFEPEMSLPQAFYTGLAAEVAAKAPGKTMVFLTGVTNEPVERGGTKINWTGKIPFADPAAELNELIQPSPELGFQAPL